MNCASTSANCTSVSASVSVKASGPSASATRNNAKVHAFSKSCPGRKRYPVIPNPISSFLSWGQGETHESGDSEDFEDSEESGPSYNIYSHSVSQVQVI